MATAWIASVTLGLAAIFYIFLSLGLPNGEYAMGGQHKVMPKKLRLACAVSVAVQAFAILSLLEVGQVISLKPLQGIAREACFIFAVFFTINVLANAFSRSRKERLVMTPLSLITAVCFWSTAIQG